MKLQSIMHQGLVIAGLSAVFTLFPASTRAQEITNTEFTDGPNVTTMAQPSAPQQAAGASSSALPSAQALRASQSIGASVRSEQASLVQVPAHSDSWVTPSVLVCVLLISLYALAIAKRADRTRGSYSTHSA